MKKKKKTKRRRTKGIDRVATRVMQPAPAFAKEGSEILGKIIGEGAYSHRAVQLVAQQRQKLTR
jgi:hypothetical protein